MASGHKNNNNNNKNRGGDQIMFNKIKTIEVWSHENQGWDVLSELAPHEYMVLLLDSQNMRLFPANAKWGSVDDVPPMLAWDRPHILGFHLWNSNMELNTNNNQPAASISFRLREAGVLSQVGETSNGGAITHIAQTIQEGLPDDKCLFLRFQFYSQIFKVWIPMLKKQNINYLNKFDPDTDRPAQKFKAPPAAISLSSSTSSSGVLNPALWFKDSMKSSFEFWDENKRRWMAPRMLDVEDFRFTMRNGMVYYYVAAYSENLRQPALSRENNDAVQSQVISWPIGDVIGFGNDENSPGPGSLTYAIAMKIKSPGTHSSFGDPSEDMLQQHRSRYNKNCQTSQKIHDLIRDELASSLDDPHATLWVRFQSSKPFPKASPFLKEDAQMTFMGSVTDTLPQKFPCNPQGHYNMNKRQESIASSRDNQMNNENGSWRSPEKATFNSINNNHNNSKHSKNNRSPGGDKGWGNDFGGGKQKEKGTVAENVDWAAAAMADTKPLDEFWTKDGSDEQKDSNNAGGDDDGWAVPPSVELLDWDTPAVPANNDWDSPAGQQVTDHEWGIGDTKSSAAATGGAEKAAAASGWDDQIQDAPGQTDLLTGQPPPTAPKYMQNNNNYNNDNNNHKGGWGNSNHVEKKPDHFDAKRTRKPRERPGDNNSNHNNSYGQYQQGGHHHNHNNHHDNHNNMRPPPSPAGKHNKHMKDNGPNRSRNNNKNNINNNSNNDNFSRGDITDRSDLISIISSANHKRMSSMGSDAGGGYEPSNNDWDNHHHQHNQYHKNNYDHDHNSTSNGTVGGGGGGSGSVSSGPYDAKNKFQGSGGGYLAALDGFVIGAQQQQHDQDSSEDTSRDRFFRRDYTKEQVKNLHDRRKTLLENLKDVDEQIKLLQQKMDYQDELWKVSLELNKRKRNGER